MRRDLIIAAFAALGVIGLFVMGAAAQTAERLTLKDAQQVAIGNHPRINAARFSARAANANITETRSAFFPNFNAGATGAEAETNSRIAAGNLNNPLILSRYANGVNVNQLVTDFGRTSSLVQSSEFRAQAEGERVNATEEQVLIGVDRAYFSALRAQAVLKVADQTVAARQDVLDQISALAKSGLKSGLDVSFAQVNLAEAKLLQIRSQNDLNAAYADLTLALGSNDYRTYDLSEEPLPAPLPADISALVKGALQERPDLKGLRFDLDSAFKFANAERLLKFPTVSLVGSFGLIPVRTSVLQNNYAAAGVTVSIPLFNGRLYSARQQQAELRARAIEQNVRNSENVITRDVRVAWLNAKTALQNLDVTSQLVDQANNSLDLAQARYKIGLSSIAELSQAQLNKTEADIAFASARYEYQIRRAELDYQVGTIH
jgi:outer membrane protein